MMKKMKIYGQYMRGLGLAFEKYGFEIEGIVKGTSISEIEQLLKREETDCLFSFNFEPYIAELCVKYHIKYISWVVDWPHSQIYARIARNKGIYIFVFDKIGYYEAIAKGINNIFYLPLASDIDYFEEMIDTEQCRDIERFSHDVSFMGNLYDTREQSLYDQIQYLPPLVSGYLDGLICAQKKVWGYTFIGEAIRQEMWDVIHRYVQWDLNDKYDTVYEELFEGMLCKKIAQEERKEMCSLLATNFDFALYTKSNTEFDKKIRNCGQVDYFKEMPLLFRHSKININITLRSIKSGIPLRCLDVMACKGFLLSNYQPELAEYFADGEELVIWNDFDDMMYKIDYYLQHPEERNRIAEAGYQKVKKLFHYDILVLKLLKQIALQEGV